MIASGLEPHSDSMVRDWYWRQNQRVLPVDRLHLTWVPPFYAVGRIELETVKQQLVMGEYQAAALGIYPQRGRQVLHLKLGPEESLARIAKAIEQVTYGQVSIDASLYDGGRKPPFEAHVTMDYDFKGTGIPAWPLPEGVIKLKLPEVLTEQRVGEWR